MNFMDDQIKPRADFNAVPKLYHLVQENGTRPLLSIPEKQISTLYTSNQELLSPEFYYLIQGSRIRRISTLYLCLYYPSRRSKLSILSISGEQILMLYPRLHHLSRGSRSHIIQTIKPITKIKVTHLPQCISSTTRPNSRNPRNCTSKKNAQKL